MKYLILVRHAQADNSGSIPQDFFRPLTTKGLMDAARMGYWFKNQNISVDHIVCSAAERTVKTAQVFADQIKFDFENVTQSQVLYDGRMQEYMDTLNAFNNGLNNIILVGHNPIISFFAEYLTGHDVGELPTSGIAIISFQDLQWAEISKKSGNLVELHSPDSLGVV